MPEIKRGHVYDVDFEARLPHPYGTTEEGLARLYWLGEIDPWGKWTFYPTDGGEPIYLFPDEIRRVYEV